MKNSGAEDKLFYASYANLVAGLLFVFLFVLAGILLKSALTRNDFEHQRAVLSSERAKFENEKKEFVRQQAQIFEFGKKLDNNINFDKHDKEILALLTSLEEKDKSLRALRDKFALVKEELNELSLIKSNFIFELQAKFTPQISLNPQTNALTLPSELIFEDNAPFIKNEMKPKLRGIFNAYFNSVLQNKELMRGLEHIGIEIFVSDEGFSLPQKIDLSSRRANELMNFIYSFYKDERMQKYLLSSVRVSGKDTKSSVSMRPILSNEFILQKVGEILQ